MNTQNTPSGVYMKLFNGRSTVEEELEGPGVDGPIFGPYPYIHTTFGDNLKFDPRRGILLPLIEDMIYYDGVYYSDWSIFDHSVLVADGLDKSDRLQPFETILSDPEYRNIEDSDGMNEERSEWFRSPLGSAAVGPVDARGAGARPMSTESTTSEAALPPTPCSAVAMIGRLQIEAADHQTVYSEDRRRKRLLGEAAEMIIDMAGHLRRLVGSHSGLCCLQDPVTREIYVTRESCQCDVRSKQIRDLLGDWQRTPNTQTFGKVKVERRQ